MSTERACALAALILADDNLEITAERIIAVTAAAGVKVEPIWANLFEKAMKGSDVNKLIASFSNVSSAPAQVAAAPAAAAATTTSGKKEAPKKEVKQDSDEELGFGLFD